MLIDWFTVVAQIVNFVILLVALKYLLYDRVLEAMERRRREFAEREAETERLQKEAEREASHLEERRREMEANWENMIDEARREADERRRELLEEARAEVEQQERQWRDSIRARQDRLLAELQQSTGEQATAITRRALSDLADADLEGGMVAEFVGRLEELTEAHDDEVVQALRDEGEDVPVRVRTSFELTDVQRDEIRRTLRKLVEDGHREVEWERDPDLIAGVVVEIGARSIGWTIDSYLDSLRESFAEVVRRQIEEGGRSGAVPPEEEPKAEAS
jgi:F-type H+-transporting ATPase subunit b